MQTVETGTDCATEYFDDYSYRVTYTKGKNAKSFRKAIDSGEALHDAKGLLSEVDGARVSPWAKKVNEDFLDSFLNTRRFVSLEFA